MRLLLAARVAHLLHRTWKDTELGGKEPRSFKDPYWPKSQWLLVIAL